MKAIPVPKTASIMERINALQTASPYYVNVNEVSPSSREFRAVKHDIDALFKVDACAAWETTGAWKALAGDWDGMRQAFEASFQLGETGSNRINWIVNCINLGMFSAAREACLTLRVEEQFIKMAQVAACRCGALEQAIQFVKRADGMHIDLAEGFRETVAKAADMLKTAGVSEAHVARQLDLAGEVLRRHHIRPKVNARVTSAEGFFSGVTYALPVPVSAEEAFEMNTELAVDEVDAGIEKNVAFDVVFEADPRALAR